VVRVRNADTRLAALQQAYNCGYPEIALMILGGSVRVYTRSPRSRPGWQVSDYRHPFPDGTDAVVLVDAFATGEPYRYYIVPIKEIEEIIRGLFDAAFPDGQRPVSPGSTHAVVSPESVEKYRDRWRFHAPESAKLAGSLGNSSAPAPASITPAPRTQIPAGRLSQPFTSNVQEYVAWLKSQLGDLSALEPERIAGISITLYRSYQSSPERKAARATRRGAGTGPD
jgi:hypothetical protein